MGCTAPEMVKKLYRKNHDKLEKCPGPRDLSNPNSSAQQAMAPVCPWCRRIDRAMYFDPVRREAREMRMRLRFPVDQHPPNKNPARSWSLDTRSFLVGLYVEAMGEAPDANSFAFCVAGSLARLDAAPFSDIDCFVILLDPAQSDKMKKVGKLFKQKLTAAMSQDGALMVDPVGIDPVTLCDGAMEIFTMIRDEEKDHLVHPILNAQVAFGNEALLKQLRDLLSDLPDSGMKQQGLYDLRECCTGYKPLSLTPARDGKLRIDLKKDLARPLTFCLNGLAKYHGVRVLGVRAQADELKTTRVISKQVHDIIIPCSEVLERTRVTSQLAHLGHHGDMQEYANEAALPKELMGVIEGVNCLQRMAEEFLNWLESRRPSWMFNESPFLTKSPMSFYKKA